MNPPTRLPFLLTLLAISTLVRSQDLIFREVKQPNGRPMSFVTGITQDPKGNVWMTTNEGLRKFDGVRITSYTKKSNDSNTFINPRMESVLADREGYIWIGSWGGLDRFDPISGKFTHYVHDAKNPKSLSNNIVTCILEDRAGRIWVGTHGGLNLLDRKTGAFIRFQHDPKDPKSLSNDQVRVLFEDKQGNFWAGCGSTFPGETPEGEGGLNRLDLTTGQFTRYMHDPRDAQTLVDNRVRSIFEDSRGDFWIGTGLAGLHRMDRVTGKMERMVSDPMVPGNPILLPSPTNSPFVDVITSINEDAKGALWISQLWHGPTKYDPIKHEVRHYEKESRDGGFPDNTTWRSFRTRDDVMWFSTWSNTLFKMDPNINKFDFHDIQHSVLSMTEDKDGNMLIGVYSGMVIVDKVGHVKQNYTHDAKTAGSISSSYASSVLKDGKGRIWVGTIDALDRFDGVGKGFRHYRHDVADSNSFMGSTTSNLLEDRRGQIWIAMNDGLDRFDPTTGTFTHFKNNPGDSNSLSLGYVYGLSETPDGRILAGVWGGGLCILERDGKSFRHALSGFSIATIFRDAQDMYWFGTDQGILFSKDLLTFQTLSLPTAINDQVFSAAFQEDNNGGLWIITNNNSMVLLSKDRKEIKTFNNAFGINGSDLNNNASTKDKEGNIYFGTGTGYYRIEPDKVSANPRLPEVFIHDFQVEYASVQGTPGINIPLDSSTRQVSLPFNQNTIKIGFSTIHFTSPENNRQSYILEPYDREWRDAGTADNVRYYQLPPGHYTFRVKGFSSSGLSAETSLSILIAPPWWRSWWAYGLYALLAISLIFLVDRIQKQRVISSERERNRAREMEQAREIEKAYHELRSTQSQLIHAEKMASLGELTAGIAHEIQNPLNFINNFSEVNRELLDEFKSQHAKDRDAEGREITSDPLLQDISDNLEKVTHHGKRADAIVKSMLQHSRAGSSQKERTNLNALVDEHLRLSYHAIRAREKEFNPTLKRDFDPAIGEVELVPQDIGRVVLNLINNAFHAVDERLKKGEAGYQPQVSVGTKRLAEQVQITIADNGTGIPENLRSKIFQPFFTTKPAGQGTGLGLSLSYDIVKSHGGKIEVNSETGKGTEFLITLPA